MFTLYVVLSASIKSMTLTVAFVPVLCMVSPLPAFADSACLVVCVNYLSVSHPFLFALPPSPLLPQAVCR